MPRFAAGIEYDGTDFVGWQMQRSGRSVQSTLAAAVSAVAAERVDIHGAGRTDAGVHARRQVVHFDAAAARTPRQWLLGINANLPEDVAVRWVRPAGADFDARRSALSRTYRYSIVPSSTRPVLSRRGAWWLRDSLDLAAMSAAAVCWLGEHDFSAFRAAGCQSRTANRCLTAVGISGGDSLVMLDFTANAFLYHMVRNLVGALVHIGRGRAPAHWAGELLAGRDRTRSPATAPARGLTLMNVTYPESCGLPVDADGACIMRSSEFAVRR